MWMAQAGTADFPTTSGAYQTTFNAVAGETNAFAAELTLTPTISVSPTSINFGTQLIHVPSAEQFVTVTNNTASAIALTLPPTTTGTNAADFAGTADGTTPCTASLAGGASCSIGVTFTPSVAAAETATLNIVDALDGPNHPMLVALSGNGSGTTSSILVTPSSLTLPGALLTTSSNGSVSITNTGNTPLSIPFLEGDESAGPARGRAGSVAGESAGRGSGDDEGDVVLRNRNRGRRRRVDSNVLSLWRAVPARNIAGPVRTTGFRLPRPLGGCPRPR